MPIGDLTTKLMDMIDEGRGIPIVMIPGIQGRYEWMRPAIDALATRHRVISFSLSGEPSSGSVIDAQRGFDSFTRQVDDVISGLRLKDAVLCGVSYGAFIAVRYAARHAQRLRALVLVSPPAPGWQPPSRIRRYLKAPSIFGPIFFLRAPSKFRAELQAAFPRRLDRVRFKARALRTVAVNRPSAARMANRVRLLEGVDLTADAAAVRVPTLLVIGEPELDRQISLADSLSYLRLMPNASLVQLPNTGHLGLVTKPDAFATAVSDFLEVGQVKDREPLVEMGSHGS